MSTGMIQELAQLGLLDERDGRFGFRDLASARQIAKLLNDGVRLSEIIRAVSEIRKWLPDARTWPGSGFMLAPSATFRSSSPAAARTNMVSSSWRSITPGMIPMNCSIGPTLRRQIGDIAEAERLYRLLMKSDPTDASAPFNLGNMLRAASRTVEAEAALRAATRANPAFAEAWYNLADLLDDQGRSRSRYRMLAQGAAGCTRLH